MPGDDGAARRGDPRSRADAHDEAIVRVLRGVAEPFEARRVARWRADSEANDDRFRALEAIWKATAPELDPDRGGLPGVPTVQSVVRRGTDLERREVRSGFARAARRPEVWPLAAAALLAAAGLGLWIGRSVVAPAARVEYFAGASPTTIPLPDGSLTRLAAGASLRVEEHADERRARLEGRAFFAVAEDPSRPFVVETALGRVRVTGTRFEVSAGDGGLRVVLLDGALRLETRAGHAADLRAGQVARFAPSGDFSVSTPRDPWRLLDWPGGVLLFHGTPLPLVARSLEAAFGVPVSVDEALAERTVTAWFDGEPLEDVVGSVCLLVGARGCRVSAERATLAP